jgi:hypothetical protein
LTGLASIIEHAPRRQFRLPIQLSPGFAGGYFTSLYRICVGFHEACTAILFGPRCP